MKRNTLSKDIYIINPFVATHFLYVIYANIEMALNKNIILQRIVQ